MLAASSTLFTVMLDQLIGRAALVVGHGVHGSCREPNQSGSVGVNVQAPVPASHRRGAVGALRLDREAGGVGQAVGIGRVQIAADHGPLCRETAGVAADAGRVVHIVHSDADQLIRSPASSSVTVTVN